MTEVLVVGMAVVDFLYEVDDLPAKPEKYRASNAQLVGGGGGANAACAIVKLGGKAMLASRAGCDVLGDWLVAELKRHHVDCSLLMVSERARSSFSSVLVDSRGERQIVNFRGADLSEDTALIERASPNVVLADTRWKAGTLAGMHLAHRKKLPAVLDAEAPLDFDAMSLATHIVFSRQGLESVASQLDSPSAIEVALRELAGQYSAWLGMTDGVNGVYYLHDEKFCHEPAIEVPVLDTLGAGDVWHGAFAYQLGCGCKEPAAVRFANATATLKCMRTGGGRNSPSLQEVTQFLQARFTDS